MPRKTNKPRPGATKSPMPRASRRAVVPRQARAPSNLVRHGRGSANSIKPLKFPGRQGGR